MIDDLAISRSFHLDGPFDEPTKVLLRKLMMGALLVISGIELFIIDREPLQVNDAIKIGTLTPELVLMKFHAEMFKG